MENELHLRIVNKPLTLGMTGFGPGDTLLGEPQGVLKSNFAQVNKILISPPLMYLHFLLGYFSSCYE